MPRRKKMPEDLRIPGRDDGIGEYGETMLKVRESLQMERIELIDREVDRLLPDTDRPSLLEYRKTTGFPRGAITLSLDARTIIAIDDISDNLGITRGRFIDWLMKKFVEKYGRKFDASDAKG